MQYDKTYEFEVELGVLTETDDSEGRRLAEVPVPARREVEGAAAAMVGEILQRPPRYSAVKVAGRRLYDYARAGDAVEAPVRSVVIHELALIGWDPPRARFRMRGSKGVYVRAVARDLGGHVVELRRTACGPFRVEDAGPDLLPVDAGIGHLPAERLSEEEARLFTSGGAVGPRTVRGIVRVYAGGRFLGIGEGTGESLRPRKVIAP